jgi:DNA-binding MarR family transcriptional regulator
MTPPEEPIPLLLSDVTRLFWRALEEGLRADGLDLTAGEARALLHVSRCEGLRQSVLAERMRVEPMTLVGFLDRLERHGYVERVADPQDRRAKQVRMAPAAGDVVARTMAVAQRVKAEVTRGLSDPELDQLRGMLQRMRDNLDRPAPAAGVMREQAPVA